MCIVFTANCSACVAGRSRTEAAKQPAMPCGGESCRALSNVRARDPYRSSQARHFPRDHIRRDESAYRTGVSLQTVLLSGHLECQRKMKFANARTHAAMYSCYMLWIESSDLVLWEAGGQGRVRSLDLTVSDGLARSKDRKDST